MVWTKHLRTEVLPYPIPGFEQDPRLRSYRSVALRAFGRVLRLSVNGIHRRSTGLHLDRYGSWRLGFAWHLHLDWRHLRGITVSYCSGPSFGRW